MTTSLSERYESVDHLQKELAQKKYLSDRNTAVALYLALKLSRPLLVEGPAGVGKTDLARALADSAGTEMIRLQCYEGLDESRALYEWNYHKQILYIQTTGVDWKQAQGEIFSEEFLLPRPLLRALTAPRPVVLLVDELDKSDEAFESYLLEFLSDYQVSIPELGTIRARFVPAVILTSNNTREFGDALRRRCIHAYIDFPDAEREARIISMHLPGISRQLPREAASFLVKLRTSRLRKPPGISEAVDWVRALYGMGIETVLAKEVDETLPVLLKHRQDVISARGELERFRREAHRL